MRCWARNPEERPSVVEIVKHLYRHADEWMFPGTDRLLLREYQDRVMRGVACLAEL